MTEMRRVALKTGVTLNVAIAGDPGQPAVILLHGFPESHRTWREIVPRLQDRFYLVMPDQRGFAGSDQPQDVADYKTDKLIDDVFALADALGLAEFSLVGHDWGGAIAWPTAMRGDPRVKRCVGSLQSQCLMAARQVPTALEKTFGPAVRDVESAINHIADFSIGGMRSITFAQAFQFFSTARP